MNSIISKLAEYFEKLPGIGPRQAQRFVYALLNKEDNFLNNFSKLILNLKQDIKRCVTCQRFFEYQNENMRCNICNDTNRNKNTLLVVEKDVDLENIEKAGFYDGFYFVLGGLVPAIGDNMPKEVKMRELFERIKKAGGEGLKEVVLAFAATLEGDNTILYIEKILEPIMKKAEIKISRLGRGLSTGTELEYSDKDTIVNALKNRK